MENKITGYTNLFGIIGNPVKHSLSPTMYNFAFKELGLDCVYLAFEIEKKNIENYIGSMRTLSIMGGNVTMPFKASVMPFLDEISKEAEIIGAVNTLVNDNGKIKGYNTDGKGFVLSIKSQGYQVKGSSVSIFGSGGAANAIIAACAIEGAQEIHIFARNIISTDMPIYNTIAHLKEYYPSCDITINLFDDNRALKRRLENSNILINATPIGMKPNEDATPLKNSDLFSKDHIVIDAVYNPIETRFLREAKSVGCKTIDGTGMLLWQGVEAFKLFTGGEVLPVEKISQIIFNKRLEV